MAKEETFHNKNITEFTLPIEEYNVGAYTPERDGKGQCTEVHLTFRIRGFEMPLVIRLKSRERVESFVRLLNEYGNMVWPRSETERALYENTLEYWKHEAARLQEENLALKEQIKNPPPPF